MSYVMKGRYCLVGLTLTDFRVLYVLNVVLEAMLTLFHTMCGWITMQLLYRGK
jgi:hypothetical protein